MKTKEPAVNGANSSGNGHDRGPQEALSLTPLEEFKKKRPVTLPSGAVVLLGRGSLASLVKSGRVPNPLAASAWRFCEGSLRTHIDGKLAGEVSGEERYVESMEELSGTVDALVCAVLEYPRTVMTVEEEEEASVWVGRFTEVDKDMILKLAQASLLQLEAFRPGYESEEYRPHRPKVRKITK